MGDPLEKATEGKDLIGKIQNFLAQYIGYYDRERRRDADKMLRETVAERYEEQWSRISEVQKQLVSGGSLEYVDDIESAAVKLRGFIDRVKTASYGYAGFFDAVRINQDELDKIYQFDLALFEGVSEISVAVDALSSAIGTEGLEESISNLVAVCQQAIAAYDRRDEVILATDGPGDLE
jgi:hypothetical protein